MTDQSTARTNLIGIACAIGASMFFSINDMLIKFLSGDYALHQIVLIRAVIGLSLLLIFIVPFEGGFKILHTKHLKIQLLRGLSVVFANMAYFAALAAMPLADAAAIWFVSPLIITAFSVLFLGEKVGPRRWAAVGLGLLGVIIMLRPGSHSFQLAALLPLVSALAYAFLQIMTRKIGVSEKAATSSVYTQLAFIVISTGMGLAFGHGQFAGSGYASIDFLFRAWVVPAPKDYGIFFLIGLGSGLGGYLITQAYRIAEAGLAAPFEYSAMPMAIVWGIVVFHQSPDLIGWIGIALIVGAGLYTFAREAAIGRRAMRKQPQTRL